MANAQCCSSGSVRRRAEPFGDKIVWWVSVCSILEENMIKDMPRNRIQKVPSLLRRLYYRAAYPHYREGAKIRGLMSDNELFAMISLVRTLPDNATILEIGAFFGRSTYFIENAIGHRTLRHIVVDTFKPECDGMSGQSIRSSFESNLASFLPRLTIWQMDSMGLSKRLDEENTNISFALIDGDHSYLAVKSDTEAVMKHMPMHGKLCFHDFMNPCGVMRLVGEYVEKRMIEPEFVATSMLVARKIG